MMMRKRQVLKKGMLKKKVFEVICFLYVAYLVDFFSVSNESLVYISRFSKK